MCLRYGFMYLMPELTLFKIYVQRRHNSKNTVHSTDVALTGIVACSLNLFHLWFVFIMLATRTYLRFEHVFLLQKINNLLHCVSSKNCRSSSIWLERPPVTRKVASSSLVSCARNNIKIDVYRSTFLLYKRSS